MRGRWGCSLGQVHELHLGGLQQVGPLQDAGLQSSVERTVRLELDAGLPGLHPSYQVLRSADGEAPVEPPQGA
eukprot:3134994-Lingulodinium_polyedra.AAC.1